MIKLKIAYDLSLSDCVAFFLDSENDRKLTHKENITRNTEETTENIQIRTFNAQEITHKTHHRNTTVCCVLRVLCQVCVQNVLICIPCGFYCLCICWFPRLFLREFGCLSDRFHCGSTLRVPRAETRLTVYRSSYIPVRCSSARLFPPRFSVTIDKSCIVKHIIVMPIHEKCPSRLKIIFK